MCEIINILFYGLAVDYTWRLLPHDLSPVNRQILLSALESRPTVRGYQRPVLSLHLSYMLESALLLLVLGSPDASDRAAVE